jgi:hypothetical protein
LGFGAAGDFGAAEAANLAGWEGGDLSDSPRKIGCSRMCYSKNEKLSNKKTIKKNDFISKTRHAAALLR